MTVSGQIATVESKTNLKGAKNWFILSEVSLNRSAPKNVIMLGLSKCNMKTMNKIALQRGDNS